MPGCGCECDEVAQLERRSLRLLLAINAVMFMVEAVAGWLAQSTGLLADSLDMLADASVYGIALYAVGRSAKLQTSAAAVNGVSQVVLGTGVVFEVLRRYLYGSDPVSELMMGIGTIALVANILCVMILAKHRTGGVHMRSTWICSTNDAINNLGVIVSGGLVLLLGSRFPDLVIGALIAALVIRGGARILQDAWTTRQESHVRST